jgi:lipopolysaccharide export system protein LptA
VKAFSLFLALALAAPASAAEKTLAGSVVRSDQWTVRNAKGEEEFTGHVSYVNGEQSFKSDWALWNKFAKVFSTRGHAYASRKEANGELLEAWSGHGTYDFGADKGRAWSTDGSGVRFRRTAADGGRLDGLARTASWKGADNQMTLDTAVTLVGSSETARSEAAAYSVPTRSLRLTGGPPVVEFKGNGVIGAMQAKEVELKPDDGKMVARQDVHGWIHWTSKK